MHKGMQAMFVMMNEARLGVGVQGLAQAEVAYQNARLCQGPSAGPLAHRAEGPDKPADPIIVHPDIRRMLMTIKAFVEGGRALALWTGIELDRRQAPDAERRQEADDLVAS
jgi:alkylation response protein AidB-like acyl-CoA dehydrogenase